MKMNNKEIPLIDIIECIESHQSEGRNAIRTHIDLTNKSNIGMTIIFTRPDSNNLNTIVDTIELTEIKSENVKKSIEIKLDEDRAFSCSYPPARTPDCLVY